MLKGLKKSVIFWNLIFISAMIGLYLISGALFLFVYIMLSLWAALEWASKTVSETLIFLKENPWVFLTGVILLCMISLTIVNGLHSFYKKYIKPFNDWLNK